MSKEKKIITLEIAYELVAKVHSSLCREIGRNDPENIIDDTLEVLREMLVIMDKIKRLKEGD